MFTFLESLLNENEINGYLNFAKENLNDIEEIICENDYFNHFRRINLKENEYDIVLKKLINSNITNNVFTFDSAWINVVTNKTNQNDKYHFDKSDRTIIIYLNDNFVGGEFEYIHLEKINKVTPKTGMTIMMDNQLKHRVKPVLDMVRFSLVIFLNKKKTLI